MTIAGKARPAAGLPGPARQRRRDHELGRFFGLPDPRHENDVVVTALFVVPSGSPAAPLAHQVSTGPWCTRRAGDLLRRHLIGCPCTAAAEHVVADDPVVGEHMVPGGRRRAGVPAGDVVRLRDRHALDRAAEQPGGVPALPLPGSTSSGQAMRASS